MVEGSLHDRELVRRILRDDGIEAVIHCAARAQVCTILTQNHVDPPVLDLWTYVAEMGGMPS